MPTDFDFDPPTDFDPHHEKEHVKIRVQPSFRAVGQTHVKLKWQTFGKPENKRQMYGSQA